MAGCFRMALVEKRELFGRVRWVLWRLGLHHTLRALRKVKFDSVTVRHAPASWTVTAAFSLGRDADTSGLYIL